MSRQPHPHCLQIFGIDLAIVIAGHKPHAVVIVWKLPNREVVMAFFCQNSSNRSGTFRDWYQPVFISEQKKRWHSHHSQSGNRVIVHFVLEPIETWMLGVAEFGGGLQRPEQIVLLRSHLFVPAF